MIRHSIAILTLFVLALVLPVPAESQWGQWVAPTSSGQEFSSRDLEGRVVILTVWATWCPTCRRQAPLLSRLQERHAKKNLQILGFSFDKSEETLKSFIQLHSLKFPSIFARTGQGLSAAKEIQKKAGSLQAVPTLFVFDASGKLVYQHVGFTNLKTLNGVLEPLLSK